MRHSVVGMITAKPFHNSKASDTWGGVIKMEQTPGKYQFVIRSANGVIVKNLQIYGKTRQEADDKIRQMYRRCEVISCELITNAKSASANFEDVLDAIVTSNA